MNKLIIGITFFLLLANTSCKKVDEMKDNIVTAKDYVLMETEYMSLFEMVTSASANSKKLGALDGSNSLPDGVFSVQDSLLNDGDGLEFTIDFGKMKLKGNKGIYCYDGKYRAGKIQVIMDKYYGADSLTTLIRIEKSDSFYSGNGNRMTHYSGDFEVYYISGDEIKLDIVNGEGENDNVIKLEAHNSITRTVGGGTALILDDVYDVVGYGNGMDRNKANYSFGTAQKLQRKLQINCASSFTVGEVNLKNLASNIEMKIDFDPYDNKPCDKIVKFIAESREFFFTTD